MTSSCWGRIKKYQWLYRLTIQCKPIVLLKSTPLQKSIVCFWHQIRLMNYWNELDAFSFDMLAAFGHYLQASTLRFSWQHPETEMSLRVAIFGRKMWDQRERGWSWTLNFMLRFCSDPLLFFQFRFGQQVRADCQTRIASYYGVGKLIWIDGKKLMRGYSLWPLLVALYPKFYFIKI